MKTTPAAEPSALREPVTRRTERWPSLRVEGEPPASFATVTFGDVGFLDRTGDV